MEPILYVYGCDLHCPECAQAEWGDALDDGTAKDDEGPVGAVWDHQISTAEWLRGVYCGTCYEPIDPDATDSLWGSEWLQACGWHVYSPDDSDALPLDWAEIHCAWEEWCRESLGGTDSTTHFPEALDDFIDEALTALGEAYRAADLQAEWDTYGTDLLALLAS